MPVTTKLSPTVTSEVPCPILTATPDDAVATFKSPVAFVIYESVPSWYSCISDPAPNLNLSESGMIKSPEPFTVTAFDASEVPKVVIST